MIRNLNNHYLGVRSLAQNWCTQKREYRRNPRILHLVSSKRVQELIEMCWTSLGYGSCALQTQVSKTTAPLRFKLLPPGNGKGTKFMQIGHLNMPTFSSTAIWLKDMWFINLQATSFCRSWMRSGFENRSISSCHFSIQRDAPTQCTRCPGNASLPDMPSPWGSGASACQRERWCNVKSPKCKNTGDCSFKCHPPLDFQGLPCLQWTLNWNRWSWFQRKASRPSISLTSSRKLYLSRTVKTRWLTCFPNNKGRFTWWA